VSGGPLLEFQLLNFGKLTRLPHAPG
jgi:hypothetical protein